MLSIALNLGGWIGSAFLNTLAEKATSHALQKLGKRSDHSKEVGQLARSLLRAKAVLRKAERKQQRNKDDEELLRELLLQLKDAAYDVQDFFGDLDYEVLRQKVAEMKNEASHNIPSSSISFAANSSNSGDDDFAAKAHEVRERLDAVSKDMWDIIGNLNSDVGGRQDEMPARKPESSSLPTEPRMIGRDKEMEHLIRLLLSTADVSGSSTADRNASILPVVGMGGVGKTTLAQFVYQDPRVQDYFQVKRWVCVSNVPFDVKRLTREILESPAENEGSNSTNLTKLESLQILLKEKVSSKRCLLVLDDVWNGNRQEWESLFAPLSGSMIIVTTRSETVVLAMAGTLDPIFLKGLPEDDYMEFFKTCAFGSENPKDHPVMEVIAERIAAKLKGSPLAAKTLGGSLNSNKDVRHWRNILNSEIWQPRQDENNIMPILQFSSQDLPLYLKPCFSICSIYPQDYNFKATELVYLWMAQGFLVAPQPNVLLEDVGKEYLVDLTRRSFFQKGRCEGEFQIHDLMHDMAKYVSKDECFSIQNNGQEIPSSIRHLSIICTENLDLHEVMNSNYNFNKLRSLVIFSYLFKLELSSTIVGWYNRFPYIRVLHLDLRYPSPELPESIGNFKHLQFLKISAVGSSTLPESFCRLYNLKFFKVGSIKDFPIEFSNLINLRRFDNGSLNISGVTGIGKLINLQYLGKFYVKKEPGNRIGELKNLKQLHGSLHIENLENVESREYACRANLDNKGYIDELTLSWNPFRYRYGFIDFSGDTEVLEGLKPHGDLKTLSIEGYKGDKLPSWLQTQALPNLHSLSFDNCPNITDLNCISLFLKELKIEKSGLKSLSLLGGEGSVDQGNSMRSSALSGLYLYSCPSLEECLLPERLPSIKIIHIKYCSELVSLPVERFKNFISLEELSIQHCPKFTRSKKLELNPSIKVLELISCGELELSPPSCPQNRSSLIKLIISQSLHLKCLPGQLLHHMPTLETLEISSCPELRSIGGLDALTSLEDLSITDCLELRSIGGLDALTSLEDLYIEDCPKLTGSKKLELNPSIKVLKLKSCGELELSTTPSCPQNLTSLITLEISHSLHLKCLPGQLLHRMPALMNLKITSCPELTSIGGLGALTSLEYLTILECPKLTDLESLPSKPEVQRKDQFIFHWTIDKAALLKQPFAQILPSFHLNLSIHCSKESVGFDEGDDGEWLQILTSLRSLVFDECPNLRSLPTWLHRLTSLQTLHIRCPKIESLPENGLPTSLTKISFRDIHPMLKKQLEENPMSRELLEDRDRALLDHHSLWRR